MTTVRTLLALVLLVTGLLVAMPEIAAAGTPAHALQIEPLGDEIEEDAPGLGSIIGSPDAGPDPEDAGDRGGWAQLLLAVTLFGGLAFIARKIVKDSRAARGV